MGEAMTILSREEAMALPPQQRPLNCRLPGNIYHKVFEMVGAASMCWRPRPDGVFDSERASQFAAELCHFIADELDEARGTPYEPPPPDARFTNTETNQPGTLPAAAEVGESPEGPGTDGDKPLMRNREAHVRPSAIGNAAGNTFECDCKLWARGSGGLPWTEHHPCCTKRNVGKESVELVAKLLKGIECWAAEEDGVHPEAWDAYLHGLFWIGAIDKLKEALAKTELEGR